MNLTPVHAHVSDRQRISRFLTRRIARCGYIYAQWRATAFRYGFGEYEGALIEPTALYKKKSGDEIVGQLFHFVDKGGREIALRPEVTPSLARMVAKRQRNYTKPLKWFQVGSCFRYEEPQRGRTREFVQFNNEVSWAKPLRLRMRNWSLRPSISCGAWDLRRRISRSG